MEKTRRGPKAKPEAEKKVMVGFWVKKKYEEYARMEIAGLEVKYEDERRMNKELKRFNA